MKNGLWVAAFPSIDFIRRRGKIPPPFGLILPEMLEFTMPENLRRSSFRVTLPVARSDAFVWHQRPGALDRLLPPWEKIQVLKRAINIEVGTQVEFSTRLGPFPVRWLAEHTACAPPDYFEDVQLHGPFKHWRHQHRFIEQAANTSTLEDRLEYSLPGGRLGELLGGHAVDEKIERMFAYRHAVTRADLTSHALYRDRPRLSVAITGASGMVGSALTAFLTTGGHAVTAISRANRKPVLTNRVIWNPGFNHELDKTAESLDAVIHLAGENIATRRWNAKQKNKIRESRIYRTRKLCESLASLSNPPSVLLSASAVGYYGESDLEDAEEGASKGEGFLADLAAEWEAACQPAMDAGIRVVHLRFGMVLSPRSGALAAMLPLFRYSLGGKIGSGQQYWSWISLEDAIGAMHHALMESEIQGPLNVVAPASLTNNDFTNQLANTLKRWTPLPVPRSVARISLGEMADALLLSSMRVCPRGLLESGYKFRHVCLEDALRHMLGREQVTRN